MTNVVVDLGKLFSGISAPLRRSVAKAFEQVAANVDLDVLLAVGMDQGDYAALVSDAEVDLGFCPAVRDEYLAYMRAVVFLVCWTKWSRACFSAGGDQ